jgi:hypothetical protein
MGTMPQIHARMSTGLLSDGEREFFNGDKEVGDPAGYRRNARYRARQRIDQIEADLAVLEQAGQDDLVEEFYQRFERVGRLETEIAQLREQLDNDP